LQRTITRHHLHCILGSHRQDRSNGVVACYQRKGDHVFAKLAVRLGRPSHVATVVANNQLDREPSAKATCRVDVAPQHLNASDPARMFAR
jgi:hypothetical protein